MEDGTMLTLALVELSNVAAITTLALTGRKIHARREVEHREVNDKLNEVYEDREVEFEMLLLQCPRFELAERPPFELAE